MKKLTSYSKRVKYTYVKTTLVTIFVSLFFLKGYTAFEKTGENYFHVFLNGTEIGTVGEADRAEQLLQEARRNIASQSEDMIFIDADLKLVGEEALWGTLTGEDTMLAAMAGALVRYLCSRVEFNVYVTIAASAFAATVTAYFTMYLPGAISPFLPIVACALTLIPGVPLINAVDDFLNNYLTSGMTRITHTLLIMLAMTFGIAGAVGITDVPSFTDVNIAPESLYLTQALAAAMAALGFSIMFNVPKRYIPAACLGAIITVDVRDVCMVLFHTGMASASFFGAAVLSLLYFSISKYFHAPVFVVTIPAIIPLIPGVLLYRFLFAIIDISHMNLLELMMAFRTGVEAMLILLGISLGATLPDVLAHQYIERSKRKKLQKLLMKRDGNREILKNAADLDKASGRG